MNPFKELTQGSWMLIFLISLSQGQAFGQNQNDVPELIGQQFEINKVLREELERDEKFTDYKVDASFLDGFVTLNGYVKNLWQKNRLVEIAQALNGAKGVIDKLKVANISVESETLAKEIALSLYRDEVADVYELTVVTDNYGRVRISGEADSVEEKKAAHGVVERVKGVSLVENNIEVSKPEDRSDSEIEKDLQFAVEDNILLDEDRIESEVESKVAILRGEVGSELEELALKDLSVSIEGVKEARATELKVIPQKDRTVVFKIDPFEPVYSDEALARVVDQANYYDTRVFSYEIDVKAENGVVELVGKAKDQQAKEAALENAKNTLGVREVIDSIQVEDFSAEQETELLAE